MNQNERIFRKTCGAIGGTMLIFWGMITAVGFSFRVLQELLILLETPYLASNLIYYLFYAVAYLAAFMVPVAFLKRLIRKKGLVYAPMQTTLRISPWWLLAIPAGITVVFSASYINSLIVSFFRLFLPATATLPSATGFYAPAPYEWVLQFIVICVVPGFCEEFLFRGAILTNLLPFGRSNAILISALLFSLMHQNPSQLFYAFAAGVVLGVLYEMTGSIWPGTLLHICNNFASLGKNIIPYRLGDAFISYLAGSIFEVVLATVGVVCLAILIARYFSKKRAFGEGVFGASHGSLNVAPAIPIREGRWIKLFLAPTMVIFLVITAIIVLLVLLGGA